jgi:hypothetical protein
LFQKDLSSLKKSSVTKVQKLLFIRSDSLLTLNFDGNRPQSATLLNIKRTKNRRAPSMNRTLLEKIFSLENTVVGGILLSLTFSAASYIVHKDVQEKVGREIPKIDKELDRIEKGIDKELVRLDKGMQGMGNQVKESLKDVTQKANSIPAVVKSKLAGPIGFLERFQENVKENLDEKINVTAERIKIDRQKDLEEFKAQIKVDRHKDFEEFKAQNKIDRHTEGMMKENLG